VQKLPNLKNEVLRLRRQLDWLMAELDKQPPDSRFEK
jgi:hypothetical protein